MKLLNVWLLLRRWLCFLISLIAQNPTTNCVLYSGKKYFSVVPITVKVYTWKIVMVLHILAYRYTIISFWKFLLTSAWKVGLWILSAFHSLWLTSLSFCNLNLKMRLLFHVLTYTFASVDLYCSSSRSRQLLKVYTLSAILFVSHLKGFGCWHYENKRKKNLKKNILTADWITRY